MLLFCESYGFLSDLWSSQFRLKELLYYDIFLLAFVFEVVRIVQELDFVIHCSMHALEITCYFFDLDFFLVLFIQVVMSELRIIN